MVSSHRVKLRGRHKKTNLFIFVSFKFSESLEYSFLNYYIDSSVMFLVSFNTFTMSITNANIVNNSTAKAKAADTCATLSFVFSLTYRYP